MTEKEPRDLVLALQSVYVGVQVCVCMLGAGGRHEGMDRGGGSPERRY